MGATGGLVLSLFPGADLLGMAFERAGYCVVRGPDVLLGGDVRNFKAIAGKFVGVIGGPPCQSFSQAVIGHAPSFGNLTPEFERIVREAQPAWWLSENVPEAPIPLACDPSPLRCQFSEVLDAWEYGALQRRRRRFCSCLPLQLSPLPPSLRCPDPFPTVLASEHKYSSGSKDRRRAGRKIGRRLTVGEINTLMGLPETFDTPALKLPYSYSVRGNGVPLQMGIAVALAIALASSSAAGQSL